MTGHWLFLSIAEGGMRTPDWQCYEPSTADCHTWCDEPECEEGCVNYLVHQRNWKHGAQCLRLVFLEEGGTWDEQYVGPVAEVRCGPIDITWNGDCYEWRYAE